MLDFFFFFFVVVENTKYFNTHTEKWEKVLKKLTITYTKMMLDFNITNLERKKNNNKVVFRYIA